jgi:hypothetical protein
MTCGLTVKHFQYAQANRDGQGETLVCKTGRAEQDMVIRNRLHLSARGDWKAETRVVGIAQLLGKIQ